MRSTERRTPRSTKWAIFSLLIKPILPTDKQTTMEERGHFFFLSGDIKDSIKAIAAAPSHRASFNWLRKLRFLMESSFRGQITATAIDQAMHPQDKVRRRATIASVTLYWTLSITIAIQMHIFMLKWISSTVFLLRGDNMVDWNNLAEYLCLSHQLRNEGRTTLLTRIKWRFAQLFGLGV